MNVLLLNPQPDSDVVISRDHMGGFGFEIKSTNMIPPLSLAYCAAVIERAGIKVEILDAVAMRWRPAQVLDWIKRRNFNLIAINTATPSIAEDLAIAKEIKLLFPESLLALLGPHVSIFAGDALEASQADVVVRGEPENTLNDVAQALASGRPIDDIAGLTVRDEVNIRRNADRPLITDLDSLPVPARHLLPMEKYQSAFWGKKPFTTMLTSRGCFYGCSYCPYRIGHGVEWRGRSPENVLAEIQECVRRYGVREILFRDPLFTADKERVLRICELIARRDISVDWRCETRADLLTEEMVDAFARAGCKGINFGVESGNEQILACAGRKRISIDRLASVFQRCRKAGIETLAFFIIGLPGETTESVDETVRLAIELQPDAAQFTAATPYPETPYYEYLKREGLLKQDWSLYTSRAPVVGTHSLTPDQLRRLIARAYRTFYFRPPYLLMRMRKLTSPHEALRLYKGFLSALRYAGLSR
ncbi:MAG: radical SAM protein [Candidatus Abyssobacteria bacterium SURF_5]|uniref:Radical SAM protein n=1 Tax=Abyssobacteria bacterium (strain SURF_5) TaxID=2093360 RepID=A0A3A4NW43_ABYX5|nr:MAG: radical SAM protein [Candidatus Abyssubacteria bacterium SURF_5]